MKINITKYRWQFVLFCEAFIVGISFCLISFFASQLGIDKSGSWGTRRLLLFIIGISILIAETILASRLIINSNNQKNMEPTAKYFILLQVYILSTVISIEIMLRITTFNPPMRMEESNWFGAVPAEGTKLLWGKEGYAITNYSKFGEIHTPIENSNFDNIIALGDSFTEGWQVPDDQKFTSVTEMILHKSGYFYNIRNFGKSGQSVADYISDIQAFNTLYNPKIYIIQISVNDFIESLDKSRDNHFLVDSGEIINQFPQKEEFSEKFQTSSIIGQITPIIIREGLNRLEITKENNLADDELSEPTLITPKLINQQLDLLLQAANEKTIILIVLPSSPQLCGDNICFLDSTNKILLETILNRKEFILIDPMNEFKSLVFEGYFPRGFFNSASADDGHLNKHGNQIIGKLLADSIINVNK